MLGRVPHFTNAVGKESVGIFDDSLGALTILSALKTYFPHQKFMYYADEKNLHLENASSYKLHDILSHMLQFFQNSKLTIIASDIMSANFLTSPQASIRKNFITLAECLTDSAAMVARHEKLNSIGILTTKYVIDNGIFPELFKKKSISTPLTQIPCDELAEALENDKFDTWTVCKQYIGQLPRDITHIILGKAYYNVLFDKIRAEYPTLTIIDPYAGIIQAVEKSLKRTIQPITYITSKYYPELQRCSNKIMGFPIDWQEL